MTTPGRTGSWILAGRGGAGGWPEVAALAPEVFSAFEGMEEQLTALVPGRLLPLCRARMAMLLGAPEAAGPADLAQWPTAPGYGAGERAALEVAEQFVIDVTGIGPEHIERLLDHYSPAETLGLVSALWFEEARIRLGLVVGLALPDRSATGPGEE